MGDPLPYGELGYHNLKEFITDIPEVVASETRDGLVLVQALPTTQTIHINKLVAEQKRTKDPKRNGLPLITLLLLLLLPPKMN
jgi:hypothetical protein